MTAKIALNPLPKSGRERNRYLACAVDCASPVSSAAFGKQVFAATLRFLGEIGTSKTSLRVIDFDEKKQQGIVKCTHATVDEVRATLALISDIERNPAAVRVLGVSGTIKKTREKYLG